MVEERYSGDVSSQVSEDQIFYIERHLRIVCRRLGLFDDDTRDITQAILQWLIAKKLAKRAAVPGWIDRVGVHFVLRLWRRRARRRAVYETAGLDPTLRPVASDPEVFRTIDEIMLRLPPRDRQLVARMRLGDSFAQAADYVSYAPGSRARVRRRLQSAFKGILRPARGRPRPPS